MDKSWQYMNLVTPLTSALLSYLRPMKPYLPVKFHTSPLALLFCLKKHGTSLSTFYHRVKDAEASFMVVEDWNHWTFGAFNSEKWAPPVAGDERIFKGNGESFLFALRPETKVFPWTRKNSFFIRNDKEHISIGSGGDGPGLWLDEELLKGTSKKCETYDNEVLASGPEFEALNVQVWGLQAYK